MNLTSEQIAAIDQGMAMDDPEYDALVTFLARIRVARGRVKSGALRPDLDDVCPPETLVRFGEEERGLYHDARLGHYIREPIPGYSAVKTTDGDHCFPLEFRKGEINGTDKPLTIAVLGIADPLVDFKQIGRLEAVQQVACDGGEARPTQTAARLPDSVPAPTEMNSIG